MESLLESQRNEPHSRVSAEEPIDTAKPYESNAPINLSPPPSESPAASSQPIQQSVYQEREILRVIRELNHDPKALPVNAPGKVGIKAQVRARLRFTKASFDHAWKRLRSTREIADVS